MAPSFIAGLIAILAAIFPDIGSENIGITLNTLAIMISGLVVIVRQVLSGRSTWFGGRPEGFQG